MKTEGHKPYLSLARRYRPQTFDDVAGQESVSVTLKNAVSAGRIAQAYLFTGPRGVGKTTMARILAKALNCAKGPTAEPCGRCDSCREIGASASLDVLEMDAASHTGVDNIREVIIDTVSLVPNRDRRKIFIIDEAHMLSTAAFNALLKTLEEPPPHVAFVLATTEAVKIPATIASRCQRFRFRPLSAEAVSAYLEKIARSEKIAVEAPALELLAKAADGSLRDALSLLDQCGASCAGGPVREETVRDMFGLVSEETVLGVAQALAAQDARALGGWLEKIYAEGLDPKEMLRDLRAAFQEIYIGKMGGAGPAKPAWKKVAEGIGADGAAFWLRRIAAIFDSMRFDEQPRMSLEVGLYGGLEAAGDLASWVKRLEALEARLSGISPLAASSVIPAQAGIQTDGPRPADFRGEVKDPGEGNAWPKIVAAVRHEKASLASVLEQAAASREADGAWKIFFQKPFDLDMAERSRSLIEAKAAEACGKQVRVSMALGPAAASGRPEEAVDKAVPVSGAGSVPGGEWRDVTDASASCPPELQKARDILGGRVRVKKKP
ncbi:MAG TPA: DNA polymerase III subunit gamma/tau [Elusimicrobiota bacterium]|nr:DNA polymerase III subunit gamma/tau [Elusimicrobiota bacterium]